MNKISINPYLSFSANNSYASQFRGTRNKLMETKNKLDHSEHLSPQEYKNLQVKFDDLNQQAKEIALKAKKEEDALKINRGRAPELGKKLDFYA